MLMLSEEKINRTMILLTCIIIVGGLYYERSVLSNRTAKRAQTASRVRVRRTSQSLRAIRLNRRRSIVANPSGKLEESMKSLNAGNRPKKDVKEITSEKNLSLSISSSTASGSNGANMQPVRESKMDLSSSVKAFKNYTRNIKEESSR
jgi:hypothetical protein